MASIKRQKLQPSAKNITRVEPEIRFDVNNDYSNVGKNIKAFMLPILLTKVHVPLKTCKHSFAQDTLDSFFQNIFELIDIGSNINYRFVFSF